MKYVVLIALLFGMITQALAGDFRDHSWGDSRQDVISKEGEPETVSDSDLAYIDLIGVERFQVVYRFDADGLSVIFLYSIDQPDSTLAYISLFEQMEKLLGKKYGKSNEEKEGYGDTRMWLNDTYQNQPAMLERALELGHLVLGSERSTGRTDISHYVGSMQAMRHIMVYRPAGSSFGLDYSDTEASKL